MPTGYSSIAANLASVRERIARAARGVGREAAEITIVAASKTFSAEAIRAGHVAGLRHFGESRVQEWESKRSKVAELPAIWHFIGHLQSNKARRAVHLFDQVDSVDSLALARRLDSAAAEEGKRLMILAEVRLDNGSAKSGVSEVDLASIARGIDRLPHLEWRGLMTIPPNCDHPEQARPYYRKLRELRDYVSEMIQRRLPVLSMGMSHDFEVAIEEGASEIRIGTALFGERNVSGL
jgi:PLP dependent protein